MSINLQDVANYGFPDASTPQLHLHLGFHKTATTFLQNTLRLNLAELNAAGVGYVPRSSMRAQITRYFDRIGGAELKMIVRKIAGQEYRRLVISEENIVGGLASIRSPRPYRHLQRRLTHVVRAFADSTITIFLGVRPFSDFIPSVYCQYLRHYPFLAFEEFVQPIQIDRLSWQEILNDAIWKHPHVNFVIYDFTSFPFIEDELLRRLSFDVLQEAHPKAPISLESFTDLQIQTLARRPEDWANLIAAFSKGEQRIGDKFRPFPAAATESLLRRYHSDLHWLATQANVSILGTAGLDGPIDGKSSLI